MPLVAVIATITCGRQAPDPCLAAEPPAPAAPEVRTAEVSADQAKLDRLGPAFSSHSSPHFSILSDCDGRRVARLAETGERTLTDVKSFATRLALPMKRPATKMSVIFFNQWPDFERHARDAGFYVDQAVPGFFDEASNRCLIFNFANAELLQAKQQELLVAKHAMMQSTLRDGDRDTQARNRQMRRRVRKIEAEIAEYERIVTMTVVRHEIAHQVLSNLGLQPAGAIKRRWLREGLAMQFEARSSLNAYRRADFLSGIEAGESLDLRALVSEPKRLGPGAAELSARYAQAWALVNYLVHKQPRSLAAYLRACLPTQDRAKGAVSEIERFESAFGPLDHAFERRLKRHVVELAPEPED